MIRYLHIRDKTTPPNILSLSFPSILLEVLNTVDVKISVKSENSQNMCPTSAARRQVCSDSTTDLVFADFQWA